MFNSFLKSLGGSDGSEPTGEDQAGSSGNNANHHPNDGNEGGASRSMTSGGAGSDEGFREGEGGGDDDFLIQFPPYGTNDVTSVASYGYDDDGDTNNEMMANSNHYGGAAGDGRVSVMGELPDGSTHGAGGTVATTATATATIAATDDLSSSFRQHSRQSSFAGSVVGGVNATASAGTASMATAAAQALFDLSVLLPAASATVPPHPASQQQLPQLQQQSRRNANANANANANTAPEQRVDAASTNNTVHRVAGGVGTGANGGISKRQSQDQENNSKKNKTNHRHVPWDDDDDMDLWRKNAAAVAAPEKQQETWTQQQLNGGMSSSGAHDPYFYTYGSDGEETNMPSPYGANARPYIRDWSAAAIAAAAASAPMQQAQQQQSRLPTAERREKRTTRTSLTESVGDSVEGQELSSQLRQPPPNTGARGQSTSDGAVEDASPQDDDNDDPLSTRRHWMPDRLCRHCYSCEAQFTVFRRRHHCRLCGQVFCAACSAYFINVSDQTTVDAAPSPPALESTTSAGSTASPTAASAAADPAASVGDRLERNKSPSPEGRDLHGSSSSGIISPNASTSLAVASESSSGQQTANPPTTTASRRTIRACKMCYDQVSEADSGGSNMLFGPNRGGRPAAQPSQTAVPPTPAQGTAERGVGILQSHLRPEGAPDKVQKNNGEDAQAAELARQVDAEYAAALVGSPQATPGDKVAHPAMLTSDAISSAKRASETQAQMGTRSQITNANRRLGMAAANHLEKMGKELLLSDAPLLLKEIGYTQSSSDPCEEGVVTARAERDLSRWISTLMMHATRCVQTVQQNVKEGDLLSILPYCKVKGEHERTSMTLCRMSGFLA